MDNLKIPAKITRQMLSHVNLNLPEEACGLLAGLNDLVEINIPITNQLHSATRYFMEPLELFHALEKIDAGNLSLLGIYHSHPKGPSHPSETDIKDFLYPGVASIICYYEANKWKINGFLIEDGYFQEIELKIV